MPAVHFRLHSITALLLLALWLPATQHCGLEAAGLLPTTSETCCGGPSCTDPKEQHPCGTDNCQLVEDSAYKPGTTALQLASPAWAVLHHCFCPPHDLVPDAVSPSLISPADSDAPPELAPRWQFISRAAPLARAPSYSA